MFRAFAQPSAAADVNSGIHRKPAMREAWPTCDAIRRPTGRPTALGSGNWPDSEIGQIIVGARDHCEHGRVAAATCAWTRMTSLYSVSLSMIALLRLAHLAG